MSDILTYIDEAIDALTVDGMERIAVGTGEVTTEAEIPAVQRSISIELKRIDAALGPKGNSLLYGLGEDVDQALIALTAARDSLRGVK